MWNIKNFTIVAFLILVGTAISYVVVQRSDPYKIARSEVANNAAVSSCFGKMERVSLRFTGYKLRISGTEGTGEFSFSIVGEAISDNVKVSLVKGSGRWVVSAVTLPSRCS